MERDVRATRRELAGYDSAISAATDEKTRAALQQEFDRASVKLKKQEGKLKDWIKEKELTPDPSRVQVNGFSRSASQKAVWANKKALQNAVDGGIIKTERNMAQGYRRSVHIPLSDEDKAHLINEIKAIGADLKVFIFRNNHGSSYDDKFDVVFLRLC